MPDIWLLFQCDYNYKLFNALINVKAQARGDGQPTEI